MVCCVIDLLYQISKTDLKSIRHRVFLWICYNIQKIKYCTVITQAASRDTTHNICKEMLCTEHDLFKMYKFKSKHKCPEWVMWRRKLLSQFKNLGCVNTTCTTRFILTQFCFVSIITGVHPLCSMQGNAFLYSWIKHHG